MGLEGDVVRMFPTGAGHSLLAKLGLVTCTPRYHLKRGENEGFAFRWYFCQYLLFILKKQPFVCIITFCSCWAVMRAVLWGIILSFWKWTQRQRTLLSAEPPGPTNPLRAPQAVPTSVPIVP